MHHFLNLRNKFQFNVMWHTWSVATCLRVWGQQKVTSLSCHQSHIHIDYVGDIITWLMYFTLQQQWLVTKMSEKCKCTSPNAIQVKNQSNAIRTEEKW